MKTIPFKTEKSSKYTVSSVTPCPHLVGKMVGSTACTECDYHDGMSGGSVICVFEDYEGGKK